MQPRRPTTRRVAELAGHGRRKAATRSCRRALLVMRQRASERSTTHCEHPHAVTGQVVRPPVRVVFRSPTVLARATSATGQHAQPRCPTTQGRHIQHRCMGPLAQGRPASEAVRWQNQAAEFTRCSWHDRRQGHSPGKSGSTSSGRRAARAMSAEPARLGRVEAACRSRKLAQSGRASGSSETAWPPSAASLSRLLPAGLTLQALG